MAYSTEAEFNALGLPAAALDGATDTSDWRDSAQGTIDSYLRGRYRLPLVAPYPPEIIETECKLAAYSFISVRGFDPTEGANINVAARYKEAMTWLRALSEGKVNLAVEADQTATRAEGGPIVSSRARGRVGGLGCCSVCGWSHCRCGFWGNGNCW
jgi:phage gp36-like protein